jgi:DNA-binding Xre family transcriptional regulator
MRIVVAAVAPGGNLHVQFDNGETLDTRLAGLPFDLGVSVTEAAVNADGSLVTLRTALGTYEATAHELAAIHAGLPLESPDLAVRVGSRIRALRKERGLSLRALSRETRIAPANLSHFENGHVTPRLQTLTSIARALGVSVALLVVD